MEIKKKEGQWQPIPAFPPPSFLPLFDNKNLISLQLLSVAYALFLFSAVGVEKNFNT